MKFKNKKTGEIVEWGYIAINSALVTAQQRKRLYWTNIPNITQPNDRGIVLKDILESGVGVGVEKQGTKITQSDGNYIEVENPTSPIRIGEFNSGGQGDRIYSPEGKSVSLSANGGGRGAKTGLYAVRQVGRHLVDGKRCDQLGAPTEQRLEIRTDEKTNCLSTVQKDNMIVEIEEVDSTGNIYLEPPKSNEDLIIRKLTPVECERLQGFPCGHTSIGINSKGEAVKISNTQRYKCLGNSFTVPVIEHILSFIPKETKDETIC